MLLVQCYHNYQRQANTKNVYLPRVFYRYSQGFLMSESEAAQETQAARSEIRPLFILGAIASFTIAIVLSLKFLDWFSTFALITIVGAWLLDAFTKHTYNIVNQTLFADLSFAALVFAGGYVITLLMVTENHNINVILEWVVALFLLLLVWRGNIYVCTLEEQAEAAYVAGVLAGASIVILLVLQIGLDQVLRMSLP